MNNSLSGPTRINYTNWNFWAQTLDLKWLSFFKTNALTTLAGMGKIPNAEVKTLIELLNSAIDLEESIHRLQFLHTKIRFDMALLEAQTNEETRRFLACARDAASKNLRFGLKLPILPKSLRNPRMRYHASNVMSGLKLLEKFHSLASIILEALTWIEVEDLLRPSGDQLAFLRRIKEKAYPGLLDRTQLFQRILKSVDRIELLCYLLNPGPADEDHTLDICQGRTLYLRHLRLMRSRLKRLADLAIAGNSDLIHRIVYKSEFTRLGETEWWRNTDAMLMSFEKVAHPDSPSEQRGCPMLSCVTVPTILEARRSLGKCT